MEHHHIKTNTDIIIGSNRFSIGQTVNRDFLVDTKKKKKANAKKKQEDFDEKPSFNNKSLCSFVSICLRSEM